MWTDSCAAKQPQLILVMCQAVTRSVIAANNTFNAAKDIVKSEGTEIPAAIKTRFDGTSGTGGLIKDAEAADTAASNLAGSVPLTAVASTTLSPLKAVAECC
jgi:hypothetical protein